MDQPAVSMLHFLPEAHNGGSRHSVAASFVDQRGVSPGRSGGAIAGFNRAHQRTVIYPGTQALTSDQVQAATELYTEHSHSSVDAVTVHELLVTMNMLPPPGFIVQDALESIGQPLDRVSLDGFLSVVNGVWKAAEDLTSHDMIVRHAYEAFAQAREKKKQRSENGSADSSTDDDDSPIPVVGGGGTKLLMAAKHSHPTGKQATSSSKTSDPVLLIVKSNMNRGLRNLQQFLSPSQGEPEMLRSFINLGAVDNGAGYMLDMARMSQKCADVGITTKDMSTITKFFDPTNSGELDYDEYLQLMRSDLEKLGLKSKLLTQLRRVLFQKPASSSTAAAATGVIATAATSAAPLVTVSSASISSPSSPAAAPSGGPLGVSAVTAAFNSPLRRRASGHRFSAAPQYSNVDAFETPIAATLAPLSETLSGSDAEEGDNDDPLTGDLGKSFFHSIAARQASIHEFSGNGPNLFLPVLPMEFFNEMHQNLEQCRVELEGLREYEIEAQNLKLYGTRRPRGAQRYQSDSAVGASGGAASPRKQSLNATVVSVTSSALGQTHHNLTKTHSTSQLAVAAQQTSSEMESTTVLPRIDSTRRRSDVNSDGQLGGGEGGVSQAPNSGRRYGAGHNPAIPKYQYGVPPLPLIHWSPRSGRMSNHKPTKSGEDDSVTVNQNSTLTPTEQQLSRANSGGSSARSGGGGGGSRHATPRTQSQLLQQQHGSTLLESYYSFQQLLSPQVTPRSQVVAVCGYAPTPLQPLSGRRHPVAPPPRTSNRTPEVPSPTAAQQQLKSPKHAVIRQNSPPLMAASGSGRPGAERLNTPPGGEGIAHHLEIKQSIYRLAGVDAAIEALVSPMSPLSPHQQTEISGPQSPRNYPESPQHRGRRTVSSAAIRALARASSMNGTLSSSHGGGGTSPRHINGSRSSSKKKLVRSPSTNRMLVAAAIADEDLITDVDAAPAAIGGMMGREEKIKTELFEKDLMAGNPNVLGKVSARLLKHQGSAVQAVYGHHVPRTTAQALLPKPPPRRNDPTVNSAQAPPVEPKDPGDQEGDQEVTKVSTES